MNQNIENGGDGMNEPINPKPGERWLTRGGQIARLYADDGTEPYTLHGALDQDGGWTAETWTRYGLFGRVPVSDLDLVRRYDWRYDWREELAPLWAVLKPEYRWIAMDEDMQWGVYMAKPKKDGNEFFSLSKASLEALRMPDPDCPWHETLTERPEGA